MQGCVRGVAGADNASPPVRRWRGGGGGMRESMRVVVTLGSAVVSHVVQMADSLAKT
jgi:hypothetical protein